MNKILEIIWPIAAVIIAVLVYTGVFLALCTPGMLVIYLYKKYFHDKHKHREVIIATIRS